MSWILGFIFLSFGFAQEKNQILSFSPQGYIKNVEQVHIKFSQPMVRFGDINLALPAQSSCFTNGQGRWIDTKNWVYDFNSPLPGGMSCSVKVMEKVYVFNTGGSHINEIFPRTYRPIDPEQKFILVLDSPVEKETVASHAYFVIEGVGDRIPVVVLSEAEAQKIKAAAESEYQYEKESFKGSFIAVQAQRTFPEGAKVSLVWGSGVESSSGAKSPKDETLEFNVAGPFKAEFSCEREGPQKPCIPLLSMNLSLSSAIAIKSAKGIFLEDTNKKRIYSSLESQNDEGRTRWLTFKGPFPQNTQYSLALPKDLVDEEGRKLSNINQFPLKVSTGENPALLKFASSFGVIESENGSAIPVTLRRVEKKIATKLVGWTGKFEASRFKEIIGILNDVQRSPYGETRLSSFDKLAVQKVQIKKDLESKETEVVGIPVKGSGFYVVEMESPLLGEALLSVKSPFYVRSTALVTKMAVHLKYSSNEVLAWVTEMGTALPVENSAVKIFDVLGNEIAQGRTNSQGLASIALKRSVESLPRENKNVFYEGFFVVAEKNGDFTFTHSGWDQGIEAWRFQLGGWRQPQSFIGHAVLDRTLFKPEETVSAKIFLRNTEAVRLSLPKEGQWPAVAELNHATGLQSFKIPLKWNKTNGTALFSFKLPSGIKMGSWRVSLKNEKPEFNLDVAEFSVESFRVPLVKVQIKSSSPDFVMKKAVPLDVIGQYFSGGAATQLPIKLRYSVEPSNFYPQDSELNDYSFANGSIREGIFRSGQDEGDRHIPQSGAEEFKLNQQGSYQVQIKDLKYGSGPQKLRAEVEFKDPSGEIQSSVRSFTMWPSSVVLGIKSKSWSTTPDRVEFDTVALDLFQRPLKGQKIRVDLFKTQAYSHRKRLLGGFYSYENIRDNKKIGKLCEGVTNERGVFHCSGATKETGSVVAVATTVDTQGNVGSANVGQWIVAKGDSLWFETSNDDRADFIPFKKNYEPGEIAEFQLRTPFPQARVLVTIERNSILESHIFEVKGDDPVIKIPIKKEYAPNVVVSAFAIRGRLADPKPTAMVDLGKPAFKLGMSEIRVGWSENKLNVLVQSDRKTYKARERSAVTVQVKTPSGAPAQDAEVVLVAVDEGLLELRDNRTWDLLKAMMVDRPHLISTATVQTFLTGRRHFGLKALPIGGDGGGLTRELFDTLLYWNPSLKLDKKGEAKVEIPLNDSTTSFRIVAVASRGSDQFGSGWTSIKSSQDVMILSGLAGKTRVGDEFKAGFTLRNASQERQDLSVGLTTVPALPGFEVQKVRLNPGEAQELYWNIQVPAVDALEYRVTAKTMAGKFVDEIKKNQKVLPVRVPRIVQSQWGQWPEFKKVQLKQPVGAEKNKSSIYVELSDQLGGSQTGIKEFWKNYNYSCLEQEVSRAVSTSDQKLWSRINEKLTTYVDENGLLRYFPSSYSKGSVVLTSYVLSIAHESGFSLSSENQDRLLDALDGFVMGRFKEETEQPRADLVLKKISAMEALSRYRRLKIDQLTSIDYTPDQWPFYTLLEWYQIHLWEKNIPQRSVKVEEITQQLRSRFYFSAKRMSLRDENREKMAWLMRSPQSSIMKLILATADDDKWKSDIPRMYQELLTRQYNGAWAVTSDNAWGSLTSKKITKLFAKDKVDGIFKVNIEGKSYGHKWSDGKQTNFEIPWMKDLSEVSLAQEGLGRPWVTLSSKVATPVLRPTFAGFKIEKTIVPVEQKKKGVWSVGDTAKVQLKVTPKTSQTWVVIEDPIPSGASVIQASWATAVERKEELIRFYYSWFDGNEVIEYTVRFNQVGRYKLPSSRAEAMYSPDLYAELPESEWIVVE